MKMKQGERQDSVDPASLVAQRRRTHLPVQETGVPFLIQKDPTCREQLSSCAFTIEPVLWNPGSTTAGPMYCN